MTPTHLRCPQCGSAHLAVRVATWVDFNKDGPCAFDSDDISHVEILNDDDPTGVICKDCQHSGMTETFDAKYRRHQLLDKLVGEHDDAAGNFHAWLKTTDNPEAVELRELEELLK